MEDIIDMPKILKATPLAEHRLHLLFADGVEGDVDLSHLVGKGLFSKWATVSPFEKVHLTHNNKVIAWDDELEIHADSLYLRVIGMNFEQWKDSQ